MDIYIIIFAIVSIWVIIEFGVSGLKLFTMAKDASLSSRPFIRGIAGLLLTVSAFNFFWLVLISLSQFVRLSEFPIARPLATLLVVTLGIMSIIGRRHWWNQIIIPAMTE